MILAMRFDSVFLAACVVTLSSTHPTRGTLELDANSDNWGTRYSNPGYSVGYPAVWENPAYGTNAVYYAQPRGTSQFPGDDGIPSEGGIPSQAGIGGSPGVGIGGAPQGAVAVIDGSIGSAHGSEGIPGVPGEHGDYQFEYKVEDTAGTHSRKETRDKNGRVTGYYIIALADGRQRVVEYTADEFGFRAKVDTNEPGTESQSPADVDFQSQAHSPANPISQHQVPAPAPESLPGPPSVNIVGDYPAPPRRGQTQRGTQVPLAGQLLPLNIIPPTPVSRIHYPQTGYRHSVPQQQTYWTSVQVKPPAVAYAYPWRKK